MELYRVVGPPGTGKTQYISRQVRFALEKYSPQQIYVASLTRAAALEAAGRVDLPTTQCATLHSICYHGLNRPKIAEAHAKEWSAAHRNYNITAGSARVDGLTDEPEKLSGEYGDKLLAYVNVKRMQQIPVEQWVPRAQVFYKAWCRWKQDNNYLDFTDLLEQALIRLPIAPGNPKVMFIDEAQDLSELEVALLQRWGEHLDTLVVVGDPHQCLYEWRGSSPLAMFPSDISVRIRNQSYRVSKAVHQRAIAWISRMPSYTEYEYMPTEEEGESYTSQVHWKDPRRLLERVEEILAHPSETLMIEASCGYMLNPVMEELRRAGIPFHNPWKPTHGGWNPLAKAGRGVSLHDRYCAFLRPWKEFAGQDAGFWTPQNLYEWANAMESKGTWKTGAKRQLELLVEDRHAGKEEVVQFLATWMTEEARSTFPRFSAPMLEALLWWTSKLLKKFQHRTGYYSRILERGVSSFLTTPRIIVGSIHSLKGSEADHVILFPDVSEAGGKEWKGSMAGKQAIYRQFYVGLTRARKSIGVAKAGDGLAVRL